MGWDREDQHDSDRGHEQLGSWWEQLTGENPWWLEKPRRAASPPPPPPKMATIAIAGGEGSGSISPTSFLRYVCECARCCRQGRRRRRLVILACSCSCIRLKH